MTRSMNCGLLGCGIKISGEHACPYCKRIFCPRHISPKMPNVINVHNKSHYYEHLDTLTGHPCVSYIEALTDQNSELYVERERERKKIIEDALNEKKNELKIAEKKVSKESRKHSKTGKNSVSEHNGVISHHYTKSEKPYNPWKDDAASVNRAPPPRVHDRIQSRLSLNFLNVILGVFAFIGKIKSVIILLVILFIIFFFVYAAMSPVIGFSLVDNSSIVQDMRLASLNWKNKFYHTENCTATITHGSCFQFKPKYCDNGRITDRADICGCDTGFRQSQLNCILIVNCTDSTLVPDCSAIKPYQCVNNNGAGTLIENIALCGCPENYMAVNDTCVEIQRCSDGTIYGQCSTHQPMVCDNGSLIDRASVCGCPAGLVIESIGNTNGEKCVIKRNFESQPQIPIIPAQVNPYDIESQIHTLINEQRAANGLSALNFDEALSSIARKHSQDMATRSYFAHQDPEGHDFVWRMQRDGYNCQIMVGNTIYGGAENIFQESGMSASSVPSAVVSGWMASSGHRDNILKSFWRNEGIGVAQSGFGSMYVTQVFC